MPALDTLSPDAAAVLDGWDALVRQAAAGNEPAASGSDGRVTDDLRRIWEASAVRPRRGETEARRPSLP